MGGSQTKNQSPSQQPQIDYYEKLIKLGLTIKEIPEFEKYFYTTLVETSKNSFGLSTTIQEYTLNTVDCLGECRLTFSDGLLIEGKKIKSPYRDWHGTQMEFIDASLIGLTADEACRKYPGSFGSTKHYKLGCDGWILTNIQITSYFDVHLHLNEEYKIIKITKWDND